MNDTTSRYFFNVITANGPVLDLDGSVLLSLTDAKAEAILDARSLMSSAILEGRDISGRSIEICKEDGEVLAVVAFREAIDQRE